MHKRTFCPVFGTAGRCKQPQASWFCGAKASWQMNIVNGRSLRQAGQSGSGFPPLLQGQWDEGLLISSPGS